MTRNLAPSIMPVKRVAFDTETYPIGKRPKGGDPKTGVNPVPRMVCASFYGDNHNEPELLRPDEAVGRWIGLVRDPEVKVIGHNLAFDQMIMLRAAWDLRGEDYLEDVYRAYENPGDLTGGKFNDTGVRQVLIDIATTGMFRRLGGYSLENLVGYYLDEDISEWKEGDDVWRLRYNELDGYAFDDWPSEAREYAKLDARWTFDCYRAQCQYQSSAFGPPVALENGVVVNEQFQVSADFAFAVMGGWGIAVDGEKTASLKQRYVERKDELERRLKEWGIVRPNGTSNQQAKRQFFGRMFREAGLEPVRTPGGKVSTSKDARAKLRMAGYTSERMAVIEEYDRVCSYLNKYLKPLELSHPHGVFPNWNVLVESGRSSSSQPNMQNFPKRNHPNETIPAKEVRRCFTPRGDKVFVNADWASAELRTLAQVNENWNHHPVRMAETLRAGQDLHLDFAAQLQGCSYSTAEELYAEGHEDIEQARSVAKVANFGFPGGLGAEGFVNYSYQQGVEVPPDESRRLRREWMQRWSEMEQYFGRIRSLEDYDGSVAIKQHAPDGDRGPWRYRRCDSWTSAANSMFQGMAGDGAKLALWKLIEHCYIDKRSELYGYRPNAFVHDEFLVEGPEENALRAARELCGIMVDGMRAFTPDVPIDADANIARKWGEGEEMSIDELDRKLEQGDSVV